MTAKKAPGELKPRGRKSEFKPEYTAQIELLCALGAKNDQLAIFFNKTVQTILNWREQHPAFFDAIKRGKQGADLDVALSLLERAKGATWIEEKEVKLKETIYCKKTFRKIKETERVEIVQLRKAAPPESLAIIYWLKNRQKETWRDKQDVTLTGPDGGPIKTESVQFYMPDNQRDATPE